MKHDVDSFHLFASVCLDDTLSDGAHQCGTDGSNELLCSGRSVALPEEYRSTTLRPDRHCKLSPGREYAQSFSIKYCAHCGFSGVDVRRMLRTIQLEHPRHNRNREDRK